MPTDTARRFAEMAEKIAHNVNSPFGGAFVIVAPDGEALETLLLGGDENPAQFWMVLQARIANQMKLIEEKERVQFGYKR